MSLFVVATPIGNTKDISLHAIELLKSADLIVGEERKELFQLLKQHDLKDKKVDFLNEHSKPMDLEFLVNECKTKKVVLVSDCGTPGFCDPGADLVRECRKNNIEIKSAPGASSLMTLLSVSGYRVDQFLFLGFLPRDNDERKQALKRVRDSKTAVILMDTPYRLKKLMEELKQSMPQKKAVLGCNLTQETEKILSGTIAQITTQLHQEKAEFILMVLP